MTVHVRPITDEDIATVARFLHTNLNPRVPVDAWARATDVPWRVEAPNRGFLLYDDGPDRPDEDRVVGAYLAFYSERPIDGQVERFCNLGAWCVLPGFRLHSLRLLKAMLGQEGYHFTDLSPSGNVVGLNRRLGFQFLDNTTVVIPNLPWPSWPGRHRISADPELIAANLTGADLRLYRDHEAAAAARHVLLSRDGDSCWVVFRKDRRKNLPIFASILYVSNPRLFRALARPLARYLLVHHGALASLAELRVVSGRPWPSIKLPRARPKMFLSKHLEPPQIDNLYSELACLAW
jgi:hypothetical protein